MTNWGDGYWTADRVALLKELWGRVTVQCICNAIGNLFPPKPTRCAIIGKSDRLGLPRLRAAAHRGPMKLVLKP